ncbi:MAG: hypothetical protein U1F83_17865 [Verrucomicrobiota bacterium]
MPETLFGSWSDLNSYGFRDTGAMPNITFGLQWVLGPLWFAKLYVPITLLFVGVCAWTLGRQLGLSPSTSALVGLAAAFNSDFMHTSCWGVGSQTICFGLNFLAVAIIISPRPQTSVLRYSLAGFAVGLGVMEGADIGALFSLFTGAFVIVHAILKEGPLAKRVVGGIAQLAIVGVCAGLIATASLATLVGTQIKGVAGTGQDAESKAARWSFATQYSIPKKEALGILVPGLFGFRHDTPGGAEYWGRAGSDPGWDEFVDSGGQKGQPRGAFRAGAGSTYAGVLVVLLAVYGLVQSFRKQGGPFSKEERRLVWFWAIAVLVALLLMFGRFAPFYQFFYALPLVSTIRNPAKFLHVAEWSLIILSAYGLKALCKTGFEGVTAKTNGLVSHWESWWSKAEKFDRRWVIGSVVGLVIVALTWLFFASSRDALERHIVGLTNLQYAAMGQKADQTAASESAAANARNSIRQVGRTVLFLVPAVALVAVTLSGYFRGSRAKIGAALFVALVAADMVTINRPWVIFVNWKVKYESNPVVEFLRERPYEHRVAIFPLDRFLDLRRLPREMMPLVQQYSFFAQIYGIEWTQHLFQFYNIQSLDIIQEPRVAQDKAAFESAMTSAPPLRRWELSNTRFLLGPSAFVDSLNQQIDAGKGRFRVAKSFDLAAKTGVDQSVPQSEQVTTVINTNGQLAVIEFGGALPRAKLYSNWRVSTNDSALLLNWVKAIQPIVPQDWGAALAAQNQTDLATLHELAGKDFDPTQAVLLAEPLAAVPGTNQNPGEVTFESYKPKHTIFTAKANAPCVLLFNDKFDPNWKVTVDGQPAKLLRANFIMRGVFLDKAGDHRVEFKFQPPLTGFYISVAAIVVALGLLAYVAFVKRRD